MSGTRTSPTCRDPSWGKFKDYWMLLADDPTNSTLKPQVSALTPIPPGPPAAGTTVLFSPRPGLDLLNRYADMARGAQEGLFMTFAFGMNDLWKDVYRTAAAPIRFALMERRTRANGRPEKEGRSGRSTAPPTERERFAHRAFIDQPVRGLVKERLTGRNTNVRYVHNIHAEATIWRRASVIAGSANFSEPRRTERETCAREGNNRVADVWLSARFMRSIASRLSES